MDRHGRKLPLYWEIPPEFLFAQRSSYPFFFLWKQQKQNRTNLVVTVLTLFFFLLFSYFVYLLLLFRFLWFWFLIMVPEQIYEFTVLMKSPHWKTSDCWRLTFLIFIFDPVLFPEVHLNNRPKTTNRSLALMILNKLSYNRCMSFGKSFWDFQMKWPPPPKNTKKKTQKKH